MAHGSIGSFLRNTRPNPLPGPSTGHSDLDMKVLGSNRFMAFAAWLTRLGERTVAHGSDLVEILGAAYGNRNAGEPDNTVLGDDLLQLAAEAGWIGPSGRPAATVSQQMLYAYYDPKQPRPSTFPWERGPRWEDEVRPWLARVGPLPTWPDLRPRRFNPVAHEAATGQSGDDVYTAMPMIEPWGFFGVFNRYLGTFTLDTPMEDPDEAAALARQLNGVVRRAAR